jgi:hypothetical protein
MSHTFRITKEDYLKANRIGSRMAEMEGQTGWTAKNKVHRNKKAYSRRDKHRMAYA